MCLIKGINCLCPCPGCLIPAEEQMNLLQHYPIRQIQDVKPIVDNPGFSHTTKDNMLKSKGYRPLSVGFLLLKVSLLINILLFS